MPMDILQLTKFRQSASGMICEIQLFKKSDLWGAGKGTALLKSKYLPFFYYYRREEGMCRQCFSAATLTDVILGGKNTKGLIKVI